ncbi:MAG: hypothetical protein ABL930_08710 [Pseudobdellovibrio sp.]
MNLKFFLLVFFGLTLTTQAATYKQNCRVIGEDDYLQFTIESDLSSGSSFAFKITAFEDEDCKIAYLHYDQYFKIDSIAGEKINLKTEKVTYTPLSKEVASALRMINYCNTKNWNAKVAVDVTGQLCDNYQQFAKDEIFFQILKNESSILKFGTTTKALDGHSEKNRPQDFDELDYL